MADLGAGRCLVGLGMSSEAATTLQGVTDLRPARALSETDALFKKASALTL